jgi:HEAT repeat protein
MLVLLLALTAPANADADLATVSPAAGLRSVDAAVRIRTARRLGDLGPAARDAVPALLEAADDPDPGVRAEAARALCRIGGPEATALVKQFILHPTTQGKVPRYEQLTAVRNVATEQFIELLTDPEAQHAVVGLLGPDLPKAVPTLIRSLGHPDARVRQAAARAFFLSPSDQKISSPALERGAVQEALPVLAACLKDPDVGVRLTAAEALWRQDGRKQETIAVSTAALADPNANVRRTAAALLLNVGPAPEAIPALIDALNRYAADADFNRVASSALVGAGPNVVATVVRELETHKEAHVWAPDVLARSRPETTAAVPVLFDGLVDDDHRYRLRAAAALRVIAPQTAPGVVPALVELLGDKDPDVAVGAAEELLEFGPAARPALPVLAELFKSPNPRLRLHSAHVAVKIDPDTATAAVPVLAALLEDKDDNLRRPAAAWLRDTGPFAVLAVPDLLRSLKRSFDADIDETLVLAEALHRLGAGEAAVSVVVAELKSPDVDRRRFAATCLGELGAAAKSALPALGEVAQADANASVRNRAKHAIQDIEDDLPSHQ